MNVLVDNYNRRVGPRPETLPETQEYSKLPPINYIKLRVDISKYILYLFIFFIVCHQAYINIVA